mmetsp:Transcript_30083/g.63446  ORF Transcript_30083/g.63446 Transcript_30083/m.63446 type:complete len:91 (-) Transcript_30083:41-313(-)
MANGKEDECENEHILPYKNNNNILLISILVLSLSRVWSWYEKGTQMERGWDVAFNDARSIGIAVTTSTSPTGRKLTNLRSRGRSKCTYPY